MGEDNQQEQSHETAVHGPRSSSRNYKRLLAWLLILILLASNIIFVFLWHRASSQNDDYKKERTQLQKQIDTLKGKVAADENNDTDESEASSGGSTPCSETASASLRENIKAALDSKNTAAFATYTTNPVRYVLAASEYGGDVSSTEAATSLEYTHSATGPWDFSLPASTIATYDAGFYTDYFGSNTYVGRAASGMVVAFDFNCSDKIKSIFVAVDEDIL